MIHYITIGDGSIPLIALHGYGLSSRSFLFFENQLPAAFTLIAPDMPFHGQTEWREPGFLEPLDMAGIIEQLAESIIPGKKKICLLGYSMGGRIGLSLLDYMAADIQTATLLAPQGLTDSFIYWLATQTIIGNRLFRFTMHKPGWFIRFLSLIKSPRHRFFVSFLESEESRDLLYQRWTVLRKFYPSLKKIKKSVHRNKTSVNLVFGNSDEVIPYPEEDGFIKDISAFGCIKTLPCGHNMLTEKNLPDLISLLSL